MNVDEPIFSIEEAEKLGFDSVNQIEEVSDLGFEFKWKYNFYQGTYNKKVKNLLNNKKGDKNEQE